MEKKTVNILGTEYEVEFDHNEKDSDGQAFFYKNKIKIKPTEKLIYEELSEEEKEKRQKEVLRHELFHCYFHEAGNDTYAYNESLVDLLAILSPKIFKVFQELNIL